MKKSEKKAAEATFAAELARQDVTNNRTCKHPEFSHVGSTATHAKGFTGDYGIRDYLMAKGVGSTDDVRCRPATQHDWELVVRKDGKTCRIVGETKVGTGAVRYGRTAEDVACEADAIYPDVDFIAYCVDGRKLKAHPERMETLYRVFTRDQFIQVLTDCGSKGLESRLRVHKSTSGTWQLEIVAWQTSQTAARLAKYEEWIKVNTIPTLVEFRNWVRG